MYLNLKFYLHFIWCAGINEYMLQLWKPTEKSKLIHIDINIPLESIFLIGETQYLEKVDEIQPFSLI